MGPSLAFQSGLAVRVADPDAFPAMEDAMTDMISRTALLAHFRGLRNDFFNKFASQDGQPPRKFAVDFDDELDQCDQRIALIETFPSVEPVAKLLNNNQPGWQNIIETAPNVTIDVGTPLFIEEHLYRPRELDAEILAENGALRAERETAPSLPSLAPKDGVKDDCQ
jgi:hypothetical protein